MTTFTDQLWLNGEIVSQTQAGVSVSSHSLHYGVGVFDGLMAYWNDDHYYLHYGDEHLERMLVSCAHLGLSVAWSRDELSRAINQLLATCAPADYYLRPLVYRNYPQLYLTGAVERQPADVAIMAMPVQRDVDTPLTCHLSPFERVSGKAIPIGWKVCAAYANSYLVRRAAEAAGFDDGIMLDQEGRICEVSAANIFFLQGERLLTPTIRPEIFPGLTRQIVIEHAKAAGIDVREQDMRVDELDRFDGVFLTATLMELKPVTAVGDRRYDSPAHPVYRHLLTKFREVTHERRHADRQLP